MSTAAPPPAPGPQGGKAGAAGATAPSVVAPSVVAVVVARNSGPFLEEALAALGAQAYPALTVLVVDAGSRQDPTARVASVLPEAFVRRVAGDPGFGGAANEALAAVDGATFLLVCHDDVALDPGAVNLMVGEAYRSNAAIVGPKLVEADNPDLLLDVGRAIDRLGGSHTGIEPGEVDQEQHDGVRDVFYVSSAAMLVRADLFRELGGFDPDTFPGSEDLDLCWRARLAGARVMVAPDARGRHHEAAGMRGDGDVPDVHAVARARVRVILTCYSKTTLLWVVPVGLIVTLVEAIVFLPTRRRRAAGAGFGAWWWNLLHFGRVRRARRDAQSRRAIHDGDLHELQAGGGARFGAFLAHRHADQRLQSLSEGMRATSESLGDALRTPAAIALLTAFVVLIFGSRALFSHGVPAIGTFMPWPGVKGLLTELTSAWRHTNLGSTAAPPPAIAVMAGLGTLLLGGVGLAQTLVVVGSFVVGAAGAYRLARGLAAGPAAAAVTALVYGVVPVPRNAIAAGRLGPLVLYALLPFLVLLVVRAGRFSGIVGSARRPLLGIGIATAIAAAWYPPAAVAVVVVGLTFLVASLFVGGGMAALRAVGASLVGVLGAALLLAPWTVTVLDSRRDLAALGIAYHPHLDLSQVLRFQSGPAGAGVAPWGLLVAAAGALVLARGPRLAWAVRAWALTVSGFAIVWLPSRLAPGTAVAAPEAGLALAALGVAVAAGITIGAAAEELADAKRFAWRRVVVGIAVAGVVLGGLGFLGDSVSGRWGAPDGDWASVLSFTQDRAAEGEFRILWVGDPDVLPLDPVESGAGPAWVLTRNGPGDARSLWRAPITDADRVVSRALDVAVDGNTARLGRLLAPAGVRYVAVPLRNGPDGARGEPVPAVTAALAEQLDLARLRSERGLVVYENQSWAPARAVVTGRDADAVPTGAVDPLRSAVRTDLVGAKPIGGDAPIPAGTVLLGDALAGGWRAEGPNGVLPHEAAFGYLNSWVNPRVGAVSITHDGQGLRYALLAGEAVLWLVALAWWSRGRRRDRVEHAAVVRRERTERQPRRTDLSDLAFDDDDFWSDS
ncbi:MAG: glycosyltransferase [Acidimicrobiia bacterium]|nr:glycosyltransferase [Acidimicrobiia bacterium]